MSDTSIQIQFSENGNIININSLESPFKKEILEVCEWKRDNKSSNLTLAIINVVGKELVFNIFCVNNSSKEFLESYYIPCNKSLTPLLLAYVLSINDFQSTAYLLENLPKDWMKDNIDQLLIKLHTNNITLDTNNFNPLNSQNITSSLSPYLEYYHNKHHLFNKLLFDAIEESNPDKVTQALKLGAKAELLQDSTFISWNHGSNPYILPSTDKMGLLNNQSLLFEAIKIGNSNVIYELLKHNTNTNVKGKQFPPLLLNFLNKNETIAQSSKENLIKILQKNKINNNDLYKELTQNSNLKIEDNSNSIIEISKENVTKIFDPNITPLLLAVQENNIEAVRLLLRYGANFDFIDTKGLSVLDHALGASFSSPKIDIAKLLIKNGAKYGGLYHPNLSNSEMKELDSFKIHYSDIGKNLWSNANNLLKSNATLSENENEFLAKLGFNNLSAQYENLPALFQEKFKEKVKQIIKLAQNSSDIESSKMINILTSFARANKDPEHTLDSKIHLLLNEIARLIDNNPLAQDNYSHDTISLMFEKNINSISNKENFKTSIIKPDDISSESDTTSIEIKEISKENIVSEITPLDENKSFDTTTTDAQTIPTASAPVAVELKEIPKENIVSEVTPLDENKSFDTTTTDAQTIPTASDPVPVELKETPKENIVSEVAPVDENKSSVITTTAAQTIPTASAPVAVELKEIPKENIVSEVPPVDENKASDIKTTDAQTIPTASDQVAVELKETPKELDINQLKVSKINITIPTVNLVKMFEDDFEPLIMGENTQID